MSDNASIARPYAKAIFELAQESGRYDSWAEALAHLSAISQDESFTQLAQNPRVDGQQISSLLQDLCKETLPAGGDNLVRLIVTNHRIAALPEIEQQFAQLVAKAQSSINAQIVTAQALNSEQKLALSEALQQRLGLTVQLEEIVDASLLGGAIIKAGDLVIDGSAKGRLEKLTASLLR